MASEALLKGQEVAARLRISVNTLYRLADEKEIESIRVGKGRRFTETAVQDFLERQRQPATTDGAA